MGDRDAGGTAGTCKTQQVLCTAGAYMHTWCTWVLGTHLPARFTRVPVGEVRTLQRCICNTWCIWAPPSLCCMPSTYMGDAKAAVAEPKAFLV